MLIVAAEVELKFIARVKLVSVSTAGSFAPIKVDPVDHALEGFHETESGIGYACTDNNREYQ